MEINLKVTILQTVKMARDTILKHILVMMYHSFTLVKKTCSALFCFHFSDDFAALELRIISRGLVVFVSSGNYTQF